MEISVNYLAIVVAGIAAMAAGFMWYGPALFGKEWMKLMGHTAATMEAAKKDMSKTYAISFALGLVSAYVLSHVMTMSQNYFGYPRLSTGLTSAFWMWLGFIMPVQATEVLFGGKKWKLFAINTGYQLAALAVMGVVLGLM